MKTRPRHVLRKRKLASIRRRRVRRMMKIAEYRTRKVFEDLSLLFEEARV